MKRIFILLALIPALFISCGKDNGEEIPQNIYEEDSIEGHIKKALREAGITLESDTTIRPSPPAAR